MLGTKISAGTPSELRGQSCRDARVAARGRDHTRGRDRVRQQPVEHAACLEAARVLQVLQLEPDLEHGRAGRQPERAARQLPQRRAAHVRSDALGCKNDVVGGDCHDGFKRSIRAAYDARISNPEQ
jgi:hypothetical protein